MSGHSKWANIKNRKGAQDAKKGKVFSQISKMIRVAAKEGKSDDPRSNASLRFALEKARAANMPKDKVQKAIDRGMGRSKSGRVDEVLYEGYAPGGIGVLIESFTDNKQRTGGDIRSILSKAGGSLGGPGSVMYLFSRDAAGVYHPTMPMEVDEQAMAKLESLLETLVDHEDVEWVTTTVPALNSAAEEE